MIVFISDGLAFPNFLQGALKVSRCLKLSSASLVPCSISDASSLNRFRLEESAYSSTFRTYYSSGLEI